MKVSVQNAASDKKFFHDLTHENHTTANFGFVQPLMVNERAARDTVSLRCGQSVFLTPMSKPTFGRLSVKTYESFVPIVDLWHPYESFLAGQSYHGSQADYVPVEVPTIRQSALTALLLYGSKLDVFFGIATRDTVTGEIVGYSGLSAITNATDQSNFEGEYEQYLDVFVDNSNAFSFTDPGIQNRCVQPAISFPQSIPYDSYQESDFVLVFEGPTTANVYVVFANLTQEMRNIRKILLGCGYQLNFQQETVSLLPLFAYFKAYFDLFNPNRDRTWKETHAFKFMETVEQRNLSPFDIWAVNNFSSAAFLDFFKGLSYCYYTQNPDYVSAHITGAALDINTQVTENVPTLNYQGNNVNNVTVNSGGSQPVTVPTALTGITQNRLDVLRILYHRKNSESAIGGDIVAFLKAFYGNTEFDEPESNVIGSQRVDVGISMVVNQAQTSDGDLGEYAAKGLADDGGKKFTFECKTQGYVVVLSAFVPQTRYAQATDPNLFHKGKYDFFTPSLDSVTLLPTRKGCIHGAQEFGNETVKQDLSLGFGNIPNYMEYKTKFNILNGDMSLASKRSSYLPFTLDKLMPWRTHRIVSATGNVRLSNFDSSLLVASSKWRYIGLDGWLGWFNRIFINSGNDDGDYRESSSSRGYPYMEDIDDNFILYTFLEYHVDGFELPVQSSFQTVDDEDTFEVEKA